MSDENAQIATLIEKTDQMSEAMKEIAVGVSALLQFQASQTAKNEADREWRTSVEKHQDKQDETISQNRAEFEKWKAAEFKPVRDGQMRNTFITNGVIGVGGTLLGTLITTLFFLLRG
jgi:uncharacterized FAD-dependent dehydrogenase